MALTPVALVLLNAQHHHLENHPEERKVARDWLKRVAAAREAGHLIVLMQWDGDEENPTFSRAWTLYPDFRAEEGDVLVRATLPDGWSSSELGARLHAHAVREVQLLGLTGSPEGQQMADQAGQWGFEAKLLEMEEAEV